MSDTCPQCGAELDDFGPSCLCGMTSKRPAQGRTARPETFASGQSGMRHMVERKLARKAAER